jgi:hypothetical protein
MPSLLLVKVGFVVSTLTDKTLEAELVLPSASVALAVMSVVVLNLTSMQRVVLLLTKSHQM